MLSEEWYPEEDSGQKLRQHAILITIRSIAFKCQNNKFIYSLLIPNSNLFFSSNNPLNLTRFEPTFQPQIFQTKLSSPQNINNNRPTNF